MRNYLSVDIPIDDLLESMSEKDTRELVSNLIRDGYGPDNPAPTVVMEDPAERLHAITWLRANGWTVEPGV